MRVERDVYNPYATFQMFPSSTNGESWEKRKWRKEVDKMNAQNSTISPQSVFNVDYLHIFHTTKITHKPVLQ